MPTSTPNSQVCEVCGAAFSANALGGLCPKCLMQHGLREPLGQLKVRCPNCHAAIEIVEEVSVRRVICTACDSHFSLVSGEETVDSNTVAEMGRFQLIDCVGIGSFGAVWKAWDPELDRTVAVKIPRKDHLAPAEAVKFLREARYAAQLKHPNIVSVHEVGRQGDRVYIVSDFVQGCTLAEMLATERLSPRDSVELCRRIAEALQHAHDRNVIHRDLKPSNIMLDEAGQPHVMDFGLAKLDPIEITMTVDGRILGTPAYMSPEQARGQAHLANGRSDVYSLGVIMFELLTREKPFRGSSQMLLHQVLHQDAPGPRKLDATIPRDLETICLKCLEKSPDRRFETAGQLAAELGRFLEGRPIRSRPITRLQRGIRWCKRNPAMAALLLLTLLSLTAGATVASVYAVVASKRASRENQLRKLADDRAGEAARSAQVAAQARRLAEQRLTMAERSAYSLQLNLAASRMLDDPAAAQLLLEDQQLCPLHLRDITWRYLYRQARPGLRVLDAVAFSHFTTDSEGAIYIDSNGSRVVRTEIISGRQELLFELDNPEECIVAVSPDGQAIMTTDRRRWHRAKFPKARRLTLWDSRSCEELAKFDASDSPIEALGFAPDSMTCAIRQGRRITVLKIPSLEGTFSADELSSYAAFAYSTDGTSLAVEAPGKVDIWSLDNGTRTQSLAVESVQSLQFAPGSPLLAVGTHPDATLWDIETGAQILTFGDGTGTDVKALAFSPDGTTLATSSTDFPIRLYDVRTGRRWASLTGPHSHGPLAFSEDGRVLASASVKLWKVPERKPSGVLLDSQPMISGAFWPDNSTVAAGMETLPKLWNARTGARVGQIDIPPIYNLVTTPDGRLVAAAGPADVRIVRGPGSQIVQTIPAANTLAMAFSPDGRTLASTPMNTPFIDLWDWQTGTRIVRLEADRLSVLSLDFSPDGRLLAAGMGEQPRAENVVGHVHIWDLAKHTITRTLEGFRFGVYAVAFSPDGKSLAAASQDIHLLDTASWTVYRKISRHNNIVWRLAYAPDGRTLVSGSFDSTVRFWDPVTGCQRLTLDTHDYWITVVAISPRGDSLLTGSTDGLRVWHAPFTDRN